MKSAGKPTGEESVQAESERSSRGRSRVGYMVRIVATWFAFTGLYAGFAVCPFCGRQACPVGLASAASVGAFFALCVQDWRRIVRFIQRKMRGGTRPTDAA